MSVCDGWERRERQRHEMTGICLGQVEYNAKTQGAQTGTNRRLGCRQVACIARTCASRYYPLHMHTREVKGGREGQSQTVPFPSPITAAELTKKLTLFCPWMMMVSICRTSQTKRHLAKFSLRPPPSVPHEQESPRRGAQEHGGQASALQERVRQIAHNGTWQVMA